MPEHVCMLVFLISKDVQHTLFIVTEDQGIINIIPDKILI